MNRMLMRIIENKGDEVTKNRRKLQSEELHNT